MYFYLLGVSLIFPIWALLFIFKKTGRKDMLFVGFLFGIAAVLIEQFYAKFDYWHPLYVLPNIPLEDFFYGFFIGGISSEISEFIFHWQFKKYRCYRNHRYYIQNFIIFSLITIFLFIILVSILDLNSIFAHIIPPIIIGFIQISFMPKFTKIAISSAVIMVILTFSVFQILLLYEHNLFIKYWYLGNLSEIFIFKIPIEELLFAFGLGFASATIYEFIFGYDIK